MKQCPKCKTEKSMSEFGSNKSTADGHQRWCKPCVAAYDRAWSKTEAGRTAQKRLRKSERYQKRQQKYRYKNRYGRKYGLSFTDVYTMLADQNGNCAGCGHALQLAGLGPAAMCVDHDHKTGKVRSLLCSGCNKALGFLKENPMRIQGLLRYVQSFL